MKFPHKIRIFFILNFKHWIGYVIKLLTYDHILRDTDNLGYEGETIRKANTIWKLEHFLG